MPDLALTLALSYVADAMRQHKAAPDDEALRDYLRRSMRGALEVLDAEAVEPVPEAPDDESDPDRGYKEARDNAVLEGKP